MMRICMLVHNPPFQGGIVQYCVLLANALKKAGGELDLVGFKKLYPPVLYKGELPKKNRSGIQFESPFKACVTWYNPFSWYKVYTHLKRADVFHFHWVAPLLAPLYYFVLVLNKYGVKNPVVMTCHNIEPHESTAFDNWFTTAVFSKVDHFIVHAKQNRDRLINNYGFSSERVHYVPHGNFSFFTKWGSKSQKELKKDFGLSGKKVLLFFGYIREYKGLRYLIRALPKILKAIPNAHLVVAGELWQKWSTYEGEINSAGVKDKITVVKDFVPDQEVYKYFDMADIVVLPYHNTEQTISGPLLVSMAFGKPTVVSNVGGVGELINAKTGVLIKGGDADNLSDAVVKLFKNPKKAALGAAAKNAVAKFKWSDIAKKNLDVYKAAKGD